MCTLYYFVNFNVHYFKIHNEVTTYTHLASNYNTNVLSEVLLLILIFLSTKYFFATLDVTLYSNYVKDKQRFLPKIFHTPKCYHFGYFSSLFFNLVLPLILYL